MIGTEAMREERRDGVAFGAVGSGADDFDVDARQLGRFEDRLAAATARGDGGVVGQRDHRDPRDLVEPEGDLRGGQRGLLGAQAKRDILFDEMDRMGLDQKDSLAVGDGANDIPMIEAAGLGIAYHAKPKTAAAAAAKINHGDLTSILYAMGIPKSRWATI